MQKKPTCIYAQQLRFFYYEVTAFSIVLLLVFFPWFSLKFDIFLSLTGWAIGIIIRGRYFKIDDRFKQKKKEKNISSSEEEL